MITLNEKTRLKPKIMVDCDYLEFSGRSVPEDAYSFYKEIIDILPEFLKFCKEEIIVKFDLEYFNSASIKSISDIIKLVIEFGEENNIKVRINWNYNKEDEDGYETGQILSEIVNCDFNLIEK